MDVSPVCPCFIQAFLHCWNILHQAACDERNLLSISTFSSQLLLNFTCCEKIIFLTRRSQSKHPGKREDDKKEEESKFQKSCQKWENLSTEFLLGAFYMAKGRWRKCSSSFSLTETHSCRKRHFKNIRVYQVPTQTPIAAVLKRESGIGIQGKHHEICAIQRNRGHLGMKTRARASTQIHLEVCTAQGLTN